MEGDGEDIIMMRKRQGERERREAGKRRGRTGEKCIKKRLNMKD